MVKACRSTTSGTLDKHNLPVETVLTVYRIFLRGIFSLWQSRSILQPKSYFQLELVVMSAFDLSD
jgi:hypothetical protein